MSKPRIGVALAAALLLSIIWIASAHAQVQGGWSEPYRLSSGLGTASEGYCVADQYGYVHCFWSETLFVDQRVIIQYSRFDGETWSVPNSIYVTNLGIKNVSPVVDRNGTLHIAWVEGLYGPAYYTYAPANDALAARSWAKPRQIDVPGRTVRLRIDSKGVLHLLSINQIEEPGVYYVRSEDQGQTWSEPRWIDPDILPNHVPDSLNFELDENDGLHAVWWYGALDQSRPDWVRYIHSLDGGNTWSVPVLLDQYVKESDHNLTVASPVMAVEGQTVHVIWAAGEQSYRNHSLSSDAGRTWSVPKRIFGELNGQAFDGLAVDGAGRVHFFGQIRYPQGIYHAYWEHGQWTPPSLIYLILLGVEGEEMGDRIHAHYTQPVIRAGNQLVVTFTDGPADPNRRLFVMQRTLHDIAPIPALPTPVPMATPVMTASPIARQPTAVPTPTATTPWFGGEAQPAEQALRTDLALQMALFPSLLLLGGVVAVWWFRQRRS